MIDVYKRQDRTCRYRADGRGAESSRVPAHIRLCDTGTGAVSYTHLALGWAAWRLHVPVRRAVPACLAFVMLSGLAYAAADSGVVRMELAGLSLIHI